MPQNDAVEAAEAWLRECSSWMLSNDLDMECPMETDPLDIADELRTYLSQQPSEVEGLLSKIGDWVADHSMPDSLLGHMVRGVVKKSPSPRRTPMHKDDTVKARYKRRIQSTTREARGGPQFPEVHKVREVYEGSWFEGSTRCQALQRLEVASRPTVTDGLEECATIAERDNAELVEALGDGDEEKRQLWKQEGYGNNALFNDFACPGEVGFDQGWLACKNKVATLSQQPAQSEAEGLDCTPTGALGLPRWQYELRAYSAVLRATDSQLTPEARKSIAAMLRRIDQHLTKDNTDAQG